MERECRIRGIVRERATVRALQGVVVQPHDLDQSRGGELPHAVTDADGRFDLTVTAKGELYFKVLEEPFGRVVHLAAAVLGRNRRASESVEIEVSSHELGPRRPRRLELLDAEGRARPSFEPGETLLVAVSGLEADSTHVFRVRDERDAEVLRARLVADRHGVVEPTTLWPDIGLGDPEQGGEFAHPTLEAALKALAGRVFAVDVRAGRRAVTTARFRIDDALSRPRLHAATADGALQRGLLLGEDELRVRGGNLTRGAVVHVWLVERQYGWHPGDTIAPIENVDGSEVTARVELPDDETDFNVVLWPREAMRPGSYDIIARVVRPHEHRADERVLRRTDIVSDRLVTSVVVRDDIFRYKPIKKGCAMTQQIAGKVLPGTPYFQFTDNFPKGTDVWAALDPAGLMPGAVGKKVRYYVVAHKSPAQWSADNSLVDVTGTVTEIVTTDSCINGNKALVWSNPMQAGKYDLVADFGNGAPDPSMFVSDGQFNQPPDMIDGYLTVGFHVTVDPSVAGDFAVGQTAFGEPAVTIPATGVWYPSGTIGGTATGTHDLPLIAEVRYPADAPGVNVPVSAAQPSYPVVVVMHGMHSIADPSYQGYDFLLGHLASHGVIAVSIDCNSINAFNGMQDTRAHAILRHLSLLQAKNSGPGLLQGKIDLSRIALVGHSRGGDGVVQAEIYNQSLALGWSIKAVVALAPTDFSGTSPAPLVLSTSKLLCIYGSNDGDVWGGNGPATQYTGTGFRFYDRATVEKAHVFVYGATHNRFNTLWGTETRVDSGSPKILSGPVHQTLLKGYVTAFVQAHLLGRAEQLDYFSGELEIPQASTADVYAQYQPPAPRRALDDFESAAAVDQNSLGGTVTATSLDGPPLEDAAGSLSVHSPHQTRAVRLRWNAATAKYDSQVPVPGGLRDLTGFLFFSFRVSQTVASPANPANQAQDLYVRLNSAGGGPSRAVRAAYFRTIPFPYKPEYVAGFDGSEGPNTKAAFNTVRIPLHAWTIKAMAAPIVNLADVESVTFEMSAKPTGELLIDDIEFTN